MTYERLENERIEEDVDDRSITIEGDIASNDGASNEFFLADQLQNWPVAHLKDEIKIEGWEGDPMDKCITYIDDIEFDMNSNKVNTAFETDCSGTDVVTICKKKIGKFKLTFF